MIDARKKGDTRLSLISKLGTVVCPLFSLVAFALPVHAEDESEFTIAPDLADKMYDTAVEKRRPQVQTARGLSASLEYWALAPSVFQFDNDYFSVPLEDSVSSIPAGAIRVEASVGALAGADVRAFFAPGYSYTQYVAEVRSAAGVTARDALTLQWTPLHAGAAFEWVDLLGSGSRVGFDAGFGFEWITLNGELDGSQHNHWLPTIFTGPSLTVLAPPPGEIGFGGITARAQYLTSVASEEAPKLAGLMVQVGGRFAF